MFFPGSDMSQCVIALGSTVYLPEGKVKDNVGPDVQVHEVHHVKQQQKGPLRWWLKYWWSYDFRMAQELEAYQVQYHFAEGIFPSFRAKTIYAHELAEALCSPLYVGPEVWLKVGTAIEHIRSGEPLYIVTL